ncbi:hypothetical protein WJX84_009001, partial [Apatococcus fuscideae]
MRRALQSPGLNRSHLLQAFGRISRPATSNSATPPPDVMRSATADLADKFLPDPVDMVTERKVSILEPIFRDYGGHKRFKGQAATVKCFENNPLVREALGEDGKGQILIVDGGGSKRCALLGDNIAEMGYKNGWS